MSELSSTFDFKKPFLFGGVDYSVPFYILLGLLISIIVWFSIGFRYVFPEAISGQFDFQLIINNAETWYMWGTIIMILPAMPWIIESQKQNEIDKEIRNKGYYSGEGANPEDYEKMATFGIKPGVFIGIIGWIGSQIKLGEKEYFIEHSSVQKPKLSDALLEEEITLLILAYNSL